MKRILGIFVCFSLCCFYSCKTSESSFNVVNGLVDKNNRYPAVVPIEVSYKDEEGDTHEGICTASVISHNTLLTVAHCLYEAYIDTKMEHVDVIFMPNEEKKVRAKAFYFMEEFSKIVSDYNQAKVSKDMGIVVFDDHTFDGIKPLKISNQNVKKNHPVIYVGYGAGTDLSDEIDEDGFKTTVIVNKDLIKRYGTNKIYGFKCMNEQKCIVVRSYLEDLYLDPKKRISKQGTKATTWHGDSGGPVLSYNNDNLILGIISGEWFAKDESDNKDYHYSYAFKFDDTSIQWLKKIDKETKANIPFDEIK